MDETIIVDAVVREKTFIGKVNFPVAIPEGLADYLILPDDLIAHASELGLNNHAVKFLLGATRGRCAMTVDLNLPDLAPKLGMTFAEIDAIIRDLVDKKFADMTNRLQLFRLWVVLLHLKGTEFDIR
jgi:hypothetical protein